jgi:hypothetical protein
MFFKDGKVPDAVDEKDQIMTSFFPRKTVVYRPGSGKINWGEGLECKPMAESKTGHPDFTLNPEPKKSLTIKHVS